MSFISTVLALSFLIFFHELGHFLVARFFGVKAEVFSIGFGKKIFWFYYKGTQYAISLIPLGGYVRLKGQGDSKKNLEIHKSIDSHAGDSLFDKHPLERILILLAGPFFNFLIAFFIYFILFIVGIQGYSNKPIIGNVNPNFGAYGILYENDRILRVNHQKIESFSDIYETLNPKIPHDKSTILNTESQNAKVLVQRQKDSMHEEIELIVPLSMKEGQVVFGITALKEIQSFSMQQAFFRAFAVMQENIKMIYGGIRDMLLGIIGINNLSSVIGITEISAKAYDKNFYTFVLIIALISINLGILNLLPLPMLDGGQILFTLYEWITKKPLNEKIASFLVALGLSLIITFMLIGAYNDITRILKQ